MQFDPYSCTFRSQRVPIPPAVPGDPLVIDLTSSVDVAAEGGVEDADDVGDGGDEGGGDIRRYSI